MTVKEMKDWVKENNPAKKHLCQNCKSKRHCTSCIKMCKGNDTIYCHRYKH